MTKLDGSCLRLAGLKKERGKMVELNLGRCVQVLWSGQPTSSAGQSDVPRKQSLYFIYCRGVR